MQPYRRRACEVEASESYIAEKPELKKRVQIGLQGLAYEHHREEYEVMHQSLSIDIHEKLLAEEHIFAFSFIVSSTATPFERFAGNTTRHFVRVTVPGLGAFGQALVHEERVALIVNSNGKHKPAEGFEAYHETAHQVLGPMSVHVLTPYLIVGGYLQLSVVFLGLAQEVILEAVGLQLVMEMSVASMKHPPTMPYVHAYPTTLTELSSSSTSSLPQLMQKGEALNLTKRFRLPHDRETRQTTNPLSQTGIRMSHKLVFSVQYRGVSDSDVLPRKFTLTFPCRLSSCDCTLEQLQLPEFSELDPLALEAENSKRRENKECLCRWEPEVIEAIYGDFKRVEGTHHATEAPAWADKALHE